MPPPLPAVLPEMVLLVIVKVPLLKMPPPMSMAPAFPLEIVRPEIVTLKLPEAISKMRKLFALKGSRCTFNRFAPGPLIVRLLLRKNSALVSVIVLFAGSEKLIVSPDTTVAIA
ncbi:MAG: hypothetical protein DLM73_01785 [Chthoniobacterales bacterium]|nr:MAG: hypothetical protein DLM73_01785 [Chthoniobacterales bacterium]